MKVFTFYLRHLKRLHLIVGVIFLVVFWLTGAFLKFVVWDTMADDDLLRVAFRTSHVYILMAALINIATSTNLLATSTKQSHVLQCLGSLFLMVAPLILTYAFFVESKLEVEVSGFTFLAIVGLAVGVILHAVSAYMNKAHTDK